MKRGNWRERIFYVADAATEKLLSGSWFREMGLGGLTLRIFGRPVLASAWHANRSRNEHEQKTAIWGTWKM